MNCHDIKKLIPFYSEKSLEDKQFQLVRTHLADCTHCQKELKAYEQTWEMLKEAPEIEPDPGYISRFWTDLSERQTWSERVRQGFKETFSSRKLVPILATVSIVLFVGVFSLRNYLGFYPEEIELSKLSDEELEIVENMELAQDLEIIEELEFLEDLEIIEQMDSLTSQGKYLSIFG